MYLFYIDESGNRDFSHLEKERFYILTAVGMYENHWKHFHFDITRFKQSIIDRIMRDEGIKLDVSTDAEVKSTYLRNPKERDKHPFSKFQTNDERLALATMFYEQLAVCKAVIISTVIDKQAILPNSHLADQKAIHLKAWELLCERIEFYMTEAHPKHKALLITDDTGKQRNLQTTKAQITFYERGATSGQHFKHIIEMPLFVRSETCEGVQLADLCSYNVYRRFSQDDPEYPFYKRIMPFFYNSDNTDKEKVDGLKIFPPTSSFAKK